MPETPPPPPFGAPDPGSTPPPPPAGDPAAPPQEGGYPPPPPGWTGQPGEFAPGFPEAPAKRRSPILIVGGVIIVLVLLGGIAAAALKFFSQARDLERPETLSGEPLIRSAELDQVADTVGKDLAKEGDDPIVGFYGNGGVPKYAIIALREGSFGDDPTELLDGFVKGFEGEVGGQSRIAERREAKSPTGHDLECARYGGTITLTACAWQVRGTLGVLIGFGEHTVDALAGVTGEALKSTGAV